MVTVHACIPRHRRTRTIRTNGRCTLTPASVAIQNAIALFEAGQHDKAKAALRALLQRSPTDPQANKFLAMFHGALHEDDQAFLFISRAAAAAPNDPEIQFMLGNVGTIVRKYKDAARAYAAAIRLNPDNIDAYDGQGKCLLSLGDYAGSMAVYEAGYARDLRDSNLYFRHGISLAAIGRIDEALGIARRGLARLPDDAMLREFLFYYQNFADGVDPIAHRDAHADLGRDFAAQAPPGPTSFANVPDPERPLRVGFVSADFYFHACAFFLEGPLRHLDRARVRPFLYASPTKPDEVTERFKTLGEWRPIGGLPPERAGEIILADQIDILIDCAAWTDRANMRLFATRWAPVQATWLGYPNTTGLPTVDYRLVDARTDPPGAEAHCTERLARFDPTFLCYTPPAQAPATFDPTPPCDAAPNAPITFGSFNRTMKVGPKAVETWAKILKAVPDSRLLFKIQIASDEVGPAFARQFAAHGVEPSRIVAAPWTKKPGEHFTMYRRMDIALDSFPYNGTTTTCEATWMGVPMIALAGRTHRERVGVSLLHSLGTPELVAESTDEYVRLAVELAKDRDRLRRYHRDLRGMITASPLVDAPRFARDFERLLRDLWRTWCGAGR
ncbi:MAG: hypothetical protein HBSAPP03_13980 [Phycisphaerae bacterium]|nr:MAG: hypothetical protein HBSAPP03_13980 [Phycisphaerae bacterium]